MGRWSEGPVCRECKISFIAAEVVTDSGNFICRVLYCGRCNVLVDKSWWATPKMMAQAEAMREMVRAGRDKMAGTQARPRCSYCGEGGHNRRTCVKRHP